MEKKKKQVNLLWSCMGAMCPDDRKHGDSYLQYIQQQLYFQTFSDSFLL